MCKKNFWKLYSHLALSSGWKKFDRPVRERIAFSERGILSFSLTETKAHTHMSTRVACFDYYNYFTCQAIRHCLVVRIPGSHPGGPGSIPGVGKSNFFCSMHKIGFNLDLWRQLFHHYWCDSVPWIPDRELPTPWGLLLGHTCSTRPTNPAQCHNLWTGAAWAGLCTQRTHFLPWVFFMG